MAAAIHAGKKPLSCSCLSSSITRASANNNTTRVVCALLEAPVTGVPGLWIGCGRAAGLPDVSSGRCSPWIPSWKHCFNFGAPDISTSQLPIPLFRTWGSLQTTPTLGIHGHRGSQPHDDETHAWLHRWGQANRPDGRPSMPILAHGARIVCRRCWESLAACKEFQPGLYPCLPSPGLTCTPSWYEVRSNSCLIAGGLESGDLALELVLVVWSLKTMAPTVRAGKQKAPRSAGVRDPPRKSHTRPINQARARRTSQRIANPLLASRR
jgi:hypothetical protein